MSVFRTIVIMLLCGRSLAEEKEEDPEHVMKYIYKNQDPYKLIDFRCSKWPYNEFNFTKGDYYKIYFYTTPEEIGCLNKANGKRTFYPVLTALDPMMTFYIHKMHEGIVRLPKLPKSPIKLPSKIRRSAIYCFEMQMIGSTFVDYFETFNSDDETCWKIKEIVKACSTFRQSWFIWTRQVSERFCMDEDGCYKTMEFYEDDMPHCVKYIAKNQFQNVSYGSWHHSIINYCQLKDMVPEAKDPKYDRPILFEDDKTEDDLLAMCQFLRFRLLPEEGKEEEIREISLEERDSKDVDKDGNSAAFDPHLMVYIITIVYTNTGRELTENGSYWFTSDYFTNATRYLNIRDEMQVLARVGWQLLINMKNTLQKLNSRSYHCRIFILGCNQSLQLLSCTIYYYSVAPIQISDLFSL